MCATSMISDHFMNRYPVPTQFPTFVWPDYQELMRKAKLYDEATKQPECQEQFKLKWSQELERVMRERFGLVPTPKDAQPKAG